MSRDCSPRARPNTILRPSGDQLGLNQPTAAGSEFGLLAEARCGTADRIGWFTQALLGGRPLRIAVTGSTGDYEYPWFVYVLDAEGSYLGGPSPSDVGCPDDGGFESPLAFSADGRYVGFNCSGHGYLYDDITESSAPVTDPNTTSSRVWALSSDAHFVAFTSRDPLVPGDTNADPDVYILDRATATIQRASVRTDGSQIPRGATSAALSDEGTAVAFTSADSTVVPRDTNNRIDVFLRIPVA